MSPVEATKRKEKIKNKYIYIYNTHINTQTRTTTLVRDLSFFLFGLSFILPTNYLYEGYPLRIDRMAVCGWLCEEMSECIKWCVKLMDGEMSECIKWSVKLIIKWGGKLVYHF